MLKQKIIRGGFLIIIMMVLCLGVVSAVEVWYDNFDNNNYTSENWTCLSGTCEEGTTAYGTAIYGVGGFAQYESQSFDYLNLDVFNLTITLRELGSTSNDQFAYIYSNTGNSIQFYFQEATNRIFIYGTSCGYLASTFISLTYPGANWDWGVYLNTSESMMKFYQDGVYISQYNVSSCFPVNSTFRKFKMKVDNQQLLLDEFRIDDPNPTYGCNDGIDNDRDGWIDLNDRDCIDETYNEVNIDLYAKLTLYNNTLFEDDFDNNNFTSEGWVSNGNCIEKIGQSGDTIITSSTTSNSCTIYHDFNNYYENENLFNIDFYTFDYSDNSKYRLKDDSSNYLEFSFIKDRPLNTTGQKLYLPLNTNFLDASGNGNTVTSIGDVIINPFGFINSSALFDGVNDELSIADSSSLTIPQSITTMAYIYLLDHTNNNMVLVKGDAPYEYGILSGTTGGLVVYMNGNVWSVGTSLSLNTWYHFAFTRDYATGILSFYVNGQLVNSKTEVGLIPHQAKPLHIGDYSGNDFHGYIDEVRIFNRSLSANEIDTYYHTNVLSVVGYGRCVLNQTYNFDLQQALPDNVSYNFKMYINKEEGYTNIFLNNNLLYNIYDSDCFDMDNSVTSEFVLDKGSFEIDYFSITEIDKHYLCNDGLDNDNDGYTDYPDEPDCPTPFDSEDTYNTWQCNDGIDNDNDGYTDYPDDSGCSQYYDNNELPKQGTVCEDNACSETTGCILDHTFKCTSPIVNYGFSTDPDWYSSVVEGEIYNSRSVIGLHEFIGYNVSIESETYLTLNVTYFKEYTSNTKDYEIIDNEFDLFFDYQYEITGITVQNISNEYITIAFFNSNYLENKKMLEVILKPLSYNNEVWIKVYTVDELGYEYLVGTMRTADNIDFGRVEFHVELDTYEQTYRLYWTDGLGISEKSEPVDYMIYTYDYPDRFSIKVGGDPMYYSSSLKAESKMYLNNIKVYGEGKDTTTVCTEYEKPYHLIEEFNGYLENCDWSVNPENIYFNGKLYLTEDLELFHADKDFGGIYESKSRYATLDLTAVVYSYVDTIGYTLIEAMDDDYEPVFAIYLSENEDGDGGSIGYFSDGDFFELAEFDFLDTQRIYVIYDFETDTFKMRTRGQFTNLTTIGTTIPRVNLVSNPTEISNIKIFSYRGTYSLDSLKFYTSDSNGLLVSSSNDQYTEVFDPFPDKAGNSFCGYIDTDADTKFCSQDSECATGHCNKAEGTCSGFDYTYCDENGKARGNACVVSAMTSCLLVTAGDLILDNFFLVLVAIAILMFIAYFIFILRTK